MRSIRLVVLLLLVALPTGAFAVFRGAPPEDVQRTVREAVVQQVLGGRTEHVRVVMTPRPFPTEGEFRLEWSGGPIELPEGTAWMAIADETPGVLGFHPVKHVFFDEELRVIAVRDANVYPRFYVEGERQDWFTLVEYHARPGKVPADRQHAVPGRSTKAGEKDFTYQEFYAVIIEGDVPSGSSYPEFWTDPVQMYRILLEYGYQPDHIHVLYGDGEDESDWICEYYREEMVDFPAYKQDVRNIFTWMRDGNPEHGIPQVTDQDFIFLFTFDHGGSNGGCNSTLCLMDGCMPDDEFASYFNDVPYKHRAVDMQQCNSGGFIDDLENTTTVISTAADCAENAYQADETDDCEGVTTTKYGEWNYWWMSAMRGHKPWPGEEPVDADVNDDGKVSFLEAHNYAVDHDDRSEHPQWSDPGGIGDELSLQTTWNGPHLVHDGHRVDDGDGGNGDGVVNPGETIVMPVTLFNNGEEDATGVHGTLSTDSEWVTIDDADADWPDIAADTGAESLADHFRWRAAPEAPDDTDVLFHVDWTTNEGASGTTAFHERIYRVILAVQKTSVLDDDGGDGDGIADPGESIRLAVTLRNKGHAEARDVHGTLSTDSPWVTITDDQADWPNIAGQGSARSNPDHFGIDVHADAPEMTWVECTLDVTAADGYTESLPLRFMIGSRGTVLLVEDGDAEEADFMEDLIGDLGFGVERQLASETDPDTWTDYHLLVWDAGRNDDSVSDPAWRDALESFVADGGRLLITGGEIGYDHRYDDSFRQNVLHMDSYRNAGGGDLRVQDDTHPIATVPNVLDETLPAETSDSYDRDAVRPTYDARMILDWTGSEGNASLVAYDDDSLEGNGGQVVSLFVRAKTLSDEGGQRTQLVENVLEWLMGNDKPYLLYVSHEVHDEDGGNGDGVIDPGETIHMAVDLENQGSGQATITWARAETDHPEIIHFTDNYAEWPTIASGATARSLDPHLVFHVDENAACGTWVEMTLHITTDEGFAADRRFRFKVGTGGGDHVTYESTDTPMGIPNPGIADSVIDVPDAFRVGDVNCHVDIEHSSINLIKVVLRSAEGTQVTLHNMSGEGNHLETTYDTETQPDGPGTMSDFDGEVATGEWHLYVDDLQADMMMGRINSWSLIFDTSDLCHDFTCEDDVPGDVGNTLTMSKLDGTDVHLEWDAVSGADAYNVWRSRRADFSDPEATGHTTDTAYDETGVPHRSSIYFYQVRAENACHEEGP